MLVILSPAKTLDFDTPPKSASFSIPAFLEESAELIQILRQYSPDQLAAFMGVSEQIAQLNCTRFENWSMPFTPDNAKQAIFAFRGDVYTGLQADQFGEADCQFAQQHLRILSGLYGILKPLDLIQAYRLEMGTSLQNSRGKNLYQFWNEKIPNALNKEISDSHDRVIINLASNEYFKATQPKKLEADIITPIFKDAKNGRYKVISFFAKKARGLMTNYIIKNRVENPEQLRAFNCAGYQFSGSLSNKYDWVFTREEQ